MKIYPTIFLGLSALLLGAGTSGAATPVKVEAVPGLETLTLLDKQELPNGMSLQTLRDSRGRIFRQRVGKGQMPKPLAESPLKSIRKAPAEVTFYEGFEDYEASLGLNWIPEGWTKINTEAHIPTEEAISHNINNSWYVYYSSDFYQEMTTDGESEAFIHFPYAGGYGSSDAPADEWLVSPSITLGDDEVLQFLHQGDTFSVWNFDWTTMDFNFDQLDCNMLVMITTDDGQNWTQIWDYAMDTLSDKSWSYLYNTEMSYFPYEVSLADYAGETVKVAFRYINVGGRAGNSMMIDGVTVKKAGAVEEEGWNYLGMGSMADGWVTPGLTEDVNAFYNPTDYVFPVMISQSTEQPGLYKLHSPYTSSLFPFVGLNGNTEPYDIIIDATDPEFVLVSNQISGFDHNNPGNKAQRYAAPYYISNQAQYFYDEGNSRDAIISYGYNSTFDAETGRITINYPCYGHETDNGLDMGYSCSGTENYPCEITLPAGEPLPEWESIGFGTYEDGFITPGYLGNPAEYRWQVEFFAKSDEPGIYMMKNPYTSEASALYEFNAVEGSDVMIKIDASNPDMVYLVPQYSGFTGYDAGELFPYYIGNFAGYYYLAGYPKDYIEEMIGDDPEYGDKMTNDIITINTPIFGSDAGDYFGYQWQDPEGNLLNWPAKIYLPTAQQPGPVSVKGINASEEGQTLYFNLQGQPLNSKPTHGPWIEISGSKAEKHLR